MTGGQKPARHSKITNQTNLPARHSQFVSACSCSNNPLPGQVRCWYRVWLQHGIEWEVCTYSPAQYNPGWVGKLSRLSPVCWAAPAQPECWWDAADRPQVAPGAGTDSDNWCRSTVLPKYWTHETGRAAIQLSSGDCVAFLAPNLEFLDVNCSNCSSLVVFRGFLERKDKIFICAPGSW